MNDNERRVELIDYIDVILRYKWLILLVTVACTAGAHFRPLPPVWYNARSLIYVAPSQAASGDVRATEMELPSLSPAFYKKVAEADQVRLIIAARQAAMEDSLGIAPAPVGMQVGIVETAGIQLEVRSTEPTLPVGLVNAWTDTFMVLSEGLSASELGSIYQSVQAQFDTASSRLARAEKALENFDESSAISTLRAQSGGSVRQDSLLQEEILSKQQLLNIGTDRLVRARSVVASVERDGVPIYLMSAAQIENLEPATLPPLAQQLLVSMRQRDDLEKQLRSLEQDALGHLERLAAEGQNDGTARAETFQAAIDTYRGAITQAHHTLLTYRDSLRGVEAALYLEPQYAAASGSGGGSELWRQPDGRPLRDADAKRVNDLGISTGDPNRARLFLQVDRARYRVAIATAETRMTEGPAVIALLEAGGLGGLQALKRLQESTQREASGLRDQLELVVSIHSEARKRYDSAKRLTGALGPEVDALTRELRDLKSRLAEVRRSATETTRQMQRLALERDRLVRDHETLSATYARFAQLTEEARIAAQIASGNLRVITRAVTPVSEGVTRKSPLLAGAVGLLMSIIIAFFWEYMSKARAARMTAPVRD